MSLKDQYLLIYCLLQLLLNCCTNVTQEGGFTALMWTVKNKLAADVALLLRHGADVDVREWGRQQCCLCLLLEHDGSCYLWHPPAHTSLYVYSCYVFTTIPYAYLFWFIEHWYLVVYPSLWMWCDWILIVAGMCWRVGSHDRRSTEQPWHCVSSAGRRSKPRPPKREFIEDCNDGLLPLFTVIILHFLCFVYVYQLFQHIDVCNNVQLLSFVDNIREQEILRCIMECVKEIQRR